MIAHPDSSTYAANMPRRLAHSFWRMVRNRRALGNLDATQLADCGISEEALAKAIDWRFWRRLDDGASKTAWSPREQLRANLTALSDEPAL